MAGNGVGSVWWGIEHLGIRSGCIDRDSNWSHTMGLVAPGVTGIVVERAHERELDCGAGLDGGH